MQMPRFDTRGPVRVRVCVCNVSIELWTVVKKDVLFVAVDGREGTLGEFHAWACAQKVETVIARVI